MLPFVTIIVPVRDDVRIGRCLAALEAQTYPAQRMETIVVDNGSTDGTADIARRSGVRVLVEASHPSPYAARNRGLVAARGEIVAFTDADCIPEPEWLAHAVEVLERKQADLVGGRVRFALSEPPRSAEIFDALHNLDNERSIRDRGAAKTGNLVVRRSVFEAVGSFPGERRSGGDVEWTRRATTAGFALVYAADAVVEKPARRLLPLCRKLHRVGRGQIALARESREPLRQTWRRTLRCFRPGRPAALRARLEARGLAFGEERLLRVWLAAWLCTAAQGVGRVRELTTAAETRR